MRLADHGGARSVEKPQALVEKTICVAAVLRYLFSLRGNVVFGQACLGREGISNRSRVLAMLSGGLRLLGFRSFAQILGAVLKLGQMMEKYQVYFSDGAVALLGDDQFGHPAQIFAVALINLFAEDERHQVGVLLDRSRFAQVA